MNILYFKWLVDLNQSKEKTTIEWNESLFNFKENINITEDLCKYISTKTHNIRDEIYDLKNESNKYSEMINIFLIKEKYNENN